MAHPRTQIRNAMRTALMGLHTTGAHVFLTRSRPWAPSELPGLSIAVESESSLDYTPPIQIRRMELTVDAVCRAAPNTDVDALLDQIALEVEEAAYANIALRALILDLYLESIVVDVTGEFDQTLAVGQMLWVITYQVDVTDLEAIPGT